MTTLDDVVPLIERGQYEEALERIAELDDPLDRIDAITRIIRGVYNNGPLEWIPELVDDAAYVIEGADDPSDRVAGYALLASTLAAIGYTDEVVDFFDLAVAEADSIDNPVDRAVSTSILAYYLAISGYSEQALETFNAAFDALVGAEAAYRLKVDGMMRIAELMEKAGDGLPSKDALEFYRAAFDIFDKLSVNQRAAMVEKKIELAKTVYDVGLPFIRSAVLEGRNRYALALIDKMYSGVARFIGYLEVSLWLKRVNNPEYLDIVSEAFKKCTSSRFTDSNVRIIVRLLTELGNLKEALKFAAGIVDLRKKSEALKVIAFELLTRGDYEAALKIVESIPDPAVRDEAMIEINAVRGER
ncbi:hypothetical protein [Thermococcus sp.]|uniref:hypothetical protein n=1 Tax=Thermococcus sp. TaxID=35749 RepID=UPI002610A8D7|nr:hypothetical protein [Thermococcus sp.]